MSATTFFNDLDESCICCGQTLPDGEAVCLRCQTPGDLSRRVRGRGTPPQFVSILGASGAGKTVYLGLLLDMLSNGAAPIKGIANDSFSVAIQQKTVAALQQWCFPQKTPSEADRWNWAHCELASARHRRKYIDLITPDFAGEAIAMELDRPGTYRAIRSVVLQSKALVLLCDSLAVCDNGLTEDLFAVKLASYIFSLRADSTGARYERKLDLPLAVVFTKCDWCPEVMDCPEAFAKNNMGRLVQYLDQSFSRYGFFAAAVVGSSAMLVDGVGRRAQVPFHIEPRGITEPLEWILSQI